MICAMVIDGVPVLRALVVAALERTGRVRVAAECSSAEDALEALDYVQPQLIVLSDNLPGSRGSALLRSLLTIAPAARVIVLADAETEWSLHKAQNDGAAAVVRKSQGLSVLVETALGLANVAPPSRPDWRGGALLADPDRLSRRVIGQGLAQVGLEVREADCLAQAGVLLSQGRPAVLIMERAFPDGDGIAWLARTFALQPLPPTLMLAATADHQSVVAAARLGVGGWLRKPVAVKAIVNSMQHLVPNLPLSIASA